MSNPFKITIGAVGTYAFGFNKPAQFTGSYRLDHEYLKEGSEKQLTRAAVGELMVQALEKEIGSFEKYLNELRGSEMHLPYGFKPVVSEGEPSMVCLSFRLEGCETVEQKANLKAAVSRMFELAGIPLYHTEELDAYESMITLKKYVFDDHPKDYIGFLLKKKFGIWDISYTGWNMKSWVKNNGEVV